VSQTCAIIVCDHGLGHVRRCALMAVKMERFGHKVVLFAPGASLKRIQRVIPCTEGLDVHHFETKTTPERIRQGLGEAVEWVNRLPNLGRFQSVICDNFPEILARRPDATLSAQFFWHDVIEDGVQEYADYCEHLLIQYKPKIIGCEKFAMEAVRRQPGFKGVELYHNPDLVSAAKSITPETQRSLLVTGGSTPTVRDRLLQNIAKLLESGPGCYERVYVDSELIPEAPPSWMVAADFSAEMYCRIRAAICRPGLGVITDLLTVGASIYPLHESGNREMSHNACILRSNWNGSDSDILACR